jgi:hypothetical protein
MKTISVLPTGAHVIDLEHLDHKMVKFVGYKQDIKALDMVKQAGAVTLNVTDTKYRMYYMNHLKAKDLLPADAATATWANIPFEGKND